MHIRDSDFENGGEIDYAAWFNYKGKHGSVSLRLNGLDYELYVSWAENIGLGVNDQTIIHRDRDLSKMVQYANDWVRTNTSMKDREDDVYTN